MWLLFLFAFIVRGQSAQSTGIAHSVNRVSEIPFSTADAKWICVEKPMNLPFIFPTKAIGVKISRAMRESHASAEKLFPKVVSPSGLIFRCD
jgi:hypothetical protein